MFVSVCFVHKKIWLWSACYWQFYQQKLQTLATFEPLLWLNKLGVAILLESLCNFNGRIKQIGLLRTPVLQLFWYLRSYSANFLLGNPGYWLHMHVQHITSIYFFEWGETPFMEIFNIVCMKWLCWISLINHKQFPI